MIEDDFSLCMLANARKAARAVSRRYGREARKIGLTPAQFSVLTLIQQGQGKTTGELADFCFLERTTLIRNIAVLERDELVVAGAAEEGRGKVYSLTAKGEALVTKALPLWSKAQGDLAEELGRDAFLDAIRVLKILSTV